MVNFTLKGILERINKLNYIASIECTDEIVFPRVKRRLLQLNEESNEIHSVPSSVEEIKRNILNAKSLAIDDANRCSMSLTNYSDSSLTKYRINISVSLDDDDNDDEGVSTPTNCAQLTAEEEAILQEDYSQIRFAKNANKGMATYSQTKSKGTIRNKTHRHFQFLDYEGAFIRKTPALYLLQENPVLSSDRLIRVRKDDPKSASVYTNRKCS